MPYKSKSKNEQENHARPVSLYEIQRTEKTLKTSRRHSVKATEITVSSKIKIQEKQKRGKRNL